MAAFRYKAVDPSGKTHVGMVEANSAVAARQLLRSRKLLPVDVTASAEPAKQSTKPHQKVAKSPSKRAQRVPSAVLTLVTRQMSTLLGSGLRVEDALLTIAEGQPPKIAGILLTVRAAVLEGKNLSDALVLYPHVFSDFYCASVRAGEKSGQLTQVMTYLADFVENRAQNRQTVQLALLYPALLAVVSLLIITLLMTFVVPDIVRVFTSRGTDLPILTRGLITVSAFVRDFGLYLLLASAVSALVFARWLATRQNRQAWHRWLANFRLTKRLVQRMNAAQFAGTLATLVQSRVPLLEALQAAADVTPNLHIRNKINEITEKVRQGSSLRRAMAEASIFPAILIAMVASGEASGHLGPALERAATDQQRDLDAWVRAMVALVEPAILLIMGGLVMIMVLAILLPIVGMNSLSTG